jgi:hypothetical protein
VSSTSVITAILSELAEEVRRRVLDDRAAGLPDPREETHTQNFVSRLARLARSQGLGVAAREVPKTAESRLLGADVALWMQGQSGVSGLHLQAKRLYANDTYYDLGHVTHHGRQVDLLINGARQFGAGAGYMFYNGLTDYQPSKSACCLLDYSPNRNGISIARADLVEPHVGSPGAYLPRARIEDVCVPLVCISRCCTTTHPNAEDDLAAVLRSWFNVVGGGDLAIVDVREAPTYARPLFESLYLGLDDNFTQLAEEPQPPDTPSMLAIAVGPGAGRRQS